MKGNVFQSVVLIIFGVLTVVGFIFFALIRGEEDTVDSIGVVEIWGTMEEPIMKVVIEQLKESLGGSDGDVIYTQKDPRTYMDELVNAMAAGTGPDLFMLDHGDIVQQLDKVFIIPYESYTARKFKDTYIEGAEIFLLDEGIIAFPFTVDPLIMFWNRDILSREGIAVIPKYWDEFFTISPKLTKRDSSANIQLATVPFGEYRNVTNAKEIISALILQADNQITRFGTGSTKGLDVVLLNSTTVDETIVQPAESALRFYTEFSNPVKAVYSWNRALEESKRAFLAGDLAFYFGFASEIPNISKLNPNLNFDIAPLPQIRDDETESTFGKMVGIAITKSTDNLAGSFRVAALLGTDDVLRIVSEKSNLPPVSRTLLQEVPTDAYRPVLYDSAIIAHGWLEPDSERVNIIFRDMIEAITSGRSRITAAISDAQTELRNLVK